MSLNFYIFYGILFICVVHYLLRTEWVYLIMISFFLQFKKMLNKELSHFSSESKSGSQISDYIQTTFLGKKIKLLNIYFNKKNISCIQLRDYTVLTVKHFNKKKNFLKVKLYLGFSNNNLCSCFRMSVSNNNSFELNSRFELLYVFCSQQLTDIYLY